MMHVCRLRWIKVTKTAAENREGEEKNVFHYEKSERNIFRFLLRFSIGKRRGKCKREKKEEERRSNDECTLEIYFEITFFKYFFYS